MKHSLTICYVTARDHPELGWFLDSLANELRPTDSINLMIVDLFNRDWLPAINASLPSLGSPNPILHVWMCPPKPNWWQGQYRLTKENWWAVANARNTALAKCRTDWISFTDDRCVLLPGWLDAICAAQEDNYIVAGAYQKRTNMTVKKGWIRNGGIITGEDSRETHVKEHGNKTPFSCPGQWLFGCNLALPLEWALAVNGYSETLTDGLSFEDVPFGLALENHGFRIKFDPTMKIIEDRTPELSGPVMRRTDRGVSPNDKSHKVLAIIRDQKTSPNPFNLRELRERVLKTGKFPLPMGPVTDWWDNRQIKDFE